MTKFTHAAAAVLFLAAPAFAEGEGNGNPYPYAAAPALSSGRAFVTETWSEQYPQPTGSADQASSLADLLPSPGSEAPVQTANSLPARFAGRKPGYAGTERPAAVQDVRVRDAQTRDGPQHLATGPAPSR